MTKPATQGKPAIGKHIKAYLAQGIVYLDTLDEDVLSQMLLKSNEAYHTKGAPLMSDIQYDLLKTHIEDNYPDNTAILQVGAPTKKNKVKLPYNMPSMDKIKPDKGSLMGWREKYRGPYVISCKLDGVSGLYDTTGTEPKLYTRGDGIIGGDISHLIKPLKLAQSSGTVVRGEFIMTKAVFQEKYAEKFANARNLVAGFVNSKTLDKTVYDVQFVCYEVLVPQMTPSEQMVYLKSLGHTVVQNTLVTELSQDYLMDTLTNWRAASPYEMDGIIVCDDHVHPRPPPGKNPEYGFAFKMALDDQTATTVVQDVIWMASQDGYLKPRVRVTPVSIGGVTIEYATGFNAKFIEDNQVGTGAEVQLIRSGDVIPYIQAVTKPAPTGAKMPDIEYVWNGTHVDILVADLENNETVKEKNIIGFFTDLDVEGVSTGNIKRIMAAGYDSVPKILHMSIEDLRKVDGFKDKMAEKVHNSIKTKMETATLVQLMAASNKFGRGMGRRVIQPLIDAHPDFLVSADSRETKIAQLNAAGIYKGAPTFYEAIEGFKTFLTECGLQNKLVQTGKKQQTPPTIKTHVLNGKSVVMTKVRDQGIIEFLSTVGAILEDSIKANTAALVVKDKGDVTNKTKDAEKKGVTIMTVDEFKTTFIPKAELRFMQMTTEKEAAAATENPLEGKTVVMSGIRDQAIANFLGDKLADGLRANTVILVVKDKSKETAKTKEAVNRGIQIMTVDEFKDLYMS
jgi:NAD-dependent DNA ligase